MNSEQLQSDLGFVRGAVQQTDLDHRSPRAITLLWAAIVLVGVPMNDFAPQSVPWYWMVAGPAGFVISTLLGWQASRRAGQVRRRDGLRYVLHWGGLLVAIALAVLLIPANLVSGNGISPIILLLLALAYFLGGIHLERPMLWVGLLLAASYVFVLYVSTYAWTIVGVAGALALAATSLFGGSTRAEVEG